MTWVIDHYLESERLFALRLPPNDNDTEDAEQNQNDTGHYDACMASQQVSETVSQDTTQHCDKNCCREREQMGR